MKHSPPSRRLKHMFKVFSAQKLCQSEKTAIIKFWSSASVLTMVFVPWPQVSGHQPLMASGHTIITISARISVLSLTFRFLWSSLLQSSSSRQVKTDLSSQDLLAGGPPSSPQSWPHQSHCPRTHPLSEPRPHLGIILRVSSIFWPLNLILIGPLTNGFSLTNSFSENK